MFCIVVRSNAQLVHKAQEMIVAKVRSSNVTEATRAIAVSLMPHTHTHTHSLALSDSHAPTHMYTLPPPTQIHTHFTLFAVFLARQMEFFVSLSSWRNA